MWPPSFPAGSLHTCPGRASTYYFGLSRWEHPRLTCSSLFLETTSCCSYFLLEEQREELQPGLSILLTCFWGTLLGRRRDSPSQVPAPTSPLEASLASLLLIALLPEGSLAQLPLPALLFQLLPLLLRSPLLL